MLTDTIITFFKRLKFLILLGVAGVVLKDVIGTEWTFVFITGPLLYIVFVISGLILLILLGFWIRSGR